ncbi:MAG: hypothetical protein MJK13_14695 [Pseudomonadales bacterium]|nr:hypothetical protein [Pseudomonadales bacterium]
MLEKGVRVAMLGVDKEYSEYYKELFPEHELVIVAYGDTADYVICGSNNDIESVDLVRYAHAIVIDRSEFQGLLTEYVKKFFHDTLM